MRRRREIFIELTSLLDVILILLFVLLAQARSQTSAAIEDAAQAHKQAEMYKTQAQQADARARTRQLVLDHSLLCTMTVDPDGTIHLLQENNNNNNNLSIAFQWDEPTYTRNRLRNALLDLLSDAHTQEDTQSLFVVFQYDPQQIYQSEYSQISACLQALREAAQEQQVPLHILEWDSTK